MQYYSNPKIYIALPILNELELLPQLIDCIKRQNYNYFELFVCVNQPEKWWYNDKKKYICENNKKTIEYLKKYKGFPINIIDKSSKNKAWTDKRYGVGWARKVVMDAVITKAKDNDIIISLDADTTFAENYFSSIVENFKKNPKAAGLAVPYYHKLVKDDIANRAILHYEIYMRYYAINLWRIKSPYCFSALGSAISLPVWAYKGIGGITPRISGEDFYFLQKLRKYGNIIFWNEQKIYPCARFSNRVFFGTGPAMIKGRKGDWKSYPIYDYHFFDEIKQTYDLFPVLFNKDIDTPMSHFLEAQFKSMDFWQLLRQNTKDVNHFIKACHQKIDGLRILQYLKSRQKEIKHSDESNLIDFFNHFYDKKETKKIDVNFDKFSFKHSSIKYLDDIRNYLMYKEEEYQKSFIIN